MADVLSTPDPVFNFPPVLSEKPLPLTSTGVDTALATGKKCEPCVSGNDAAAFIVKLDVNDSDSGSDDGRVSPTAPCEVGGEGEVEVQAAGDTSQPLHSAHSLVVDVECAQADVGEQEDSLSTPVEVDGPPGLQAQESEPKAGPELGVVPSPDVSPPTPGPVTPLEPSVDQPPEPQAEHEASKPEPLDAPCSTESSDYIDPFDFKDSDPFAAAGLEPLEKFIPKSLFPDILIVHDPSGVTRHVSDGGIARYVRLFPKSSPKPTSAPELVAHLYLDDQHLGMGNHSTVQRAPLTLRLDENSEERSRVRVAAKIADPVCGAHDMLRREAEVYNEFPPEFQEDTVRVRDVPAPPAQPAKEAKSDEGSDADVIPAEEDAQAETVSTAEADVQDAQKPSSSSPDSKDANSDSQAEVDTESPPVVDAEEKSSSVPVLSPEEGDAKDGEGTDGSSAPATTSEDVAQRSVEHEVLPAIVPKFFGFYAPAAKDGKPIYREHSYCGINSTCHTTWPTHILLLEECGRPVIPYYMSREEREKLYSLYEELHGGGFLQGSSYVRNMLVQPGPLSVPRAQRTMENPSYRLIDFGRGEALSLLSGRRAYCFDDWMDSEQRHAKKELSL
ncbi:hypothetical protein GY45DRAFT_1324623 [Cubamyces sp. BRFM 1775]|nr:hypothetical protein GY45DRAFT_1324623 [Cubamyces sp. BRFM 1775]